MLFDPVLFDPVLFDPVLVLAVAAALLAVGNATARVVAAEPSSGAGPCAGTGALGVVPDELPFGIVRRVVGDTARCRAAAGPALLGADERALVGEDAVCALPSEPVESSANASGAEPSNPAHPNAIANAPTRRADRAELVFCVMAALRWWFQQRWILSVVTAPLSSGLFAWHGVAALRVTKVADVTNPALDRIDPEKGFVRQVGSVSGREVGDVVGRRIVQAVVGGVSVALAVFAAPVAGADPADSASQSTSTPVTAAPAADQAATAPATNQVAAPAALPAAVASPASTVTPADGAQHLPSPDSLPPGTTQQAPDHPKLGFLRDIWHAVKSGDVSAGDALLLLGTRPVNPQQLADSKPSNQTGPAPAATDAPAPAAAGQPPAVVAEASS